jgi:uncharacterized lipoprotein YehR (DUF1307 family)
MSKLDPFDTSSKKKKPAQRFENFIEAFKDTRATTKTDKVVNQADTAGNNFNFESFLNQQEQKIRQQERMRFDQMRHEEQVIYSREREQEKLEVESIKIEIKKLAKEIGGAMVEVEKTAFQIVVSPGVYHKNFFKRLLSLLQLARKKISEGRNCLAIQNYRAQCRSAYWNGVKKGGTSFMLSSDRTVATQAG